MNHETAHLREPRQTEALMNVAKHQREMCFQILHLMIVIY